MVHKVLVLGDGTGGLVVSNLMAREARRKGLAVDLKLIGRSPMHTYQPGLLFLPFRKPGYRTLADIQRPNADFVGPGVSYLQETIAAIDPQARTVTTDQGVHGYDWLVLALGCRTLVDAIEGLPERWGQRAHGFYTPSRWPARWTASKAATSWSTSPKCRSSARWRRSNSSAWSTNTSPGAASARAPG